MFWPLAAGLIALVILTLLIGRIMDVPRGENDQHHH